MVYLGLPLYYFFILDAVCEIFYIIMGMVWHFGFVDKT